MVLQLASFVEFFWNFIRYFRYVFFLSFGGTKIKGAYFLSIIDIVIPFTMLLT